MLQPSVELVCPECHSALERDVEDACVSCGRAYRSTPEGYIDFLGEGSLSQKNSTTEDRADNQSSAGAIRIDEEYILPWLMKEKTRTVLDAGCGIGRLVSRLNEEGYDARGIDLPCLSRHWKNAGNDRSVYCCCDICRLPFPDDSFDAVISMGVIEHIGTDVGHCTLQDNYLSLRQSFASELLRVTRPGGRIMITCPNKGFPFEWQHDVVDCFSSRDPLTRLRDAIYRKTGVNFHKPFGRYHLLSYAEVRELFVKVGGARDFEPLPLKGYFGLNRFRNNAFLKPVGKLAELYIERIPAALLDTPLNPYLLAQIRK